MIVTTWLPSPIKRRTLKDVPSSPESPVLCWMTASVIARLYVDASKQDRPPVVRRVMQDGTTDIMSHSPDSFPLYEPLAPQIREFRDLPLYRIITTPYGNAWARISPTEWVRSVKGGPFTDQGTLGPDYGEFTVTDYEVTKHTIDLSV